MTENDTPPAGEGIRRKTILKAALLALPVPMLIGALPSIAEGTTPHGQPLAPTPFCDDGDDPTPAQTEGPYFKPNSPLRTSLLEANTVGTRLTVTGYVFGLACQPIANALLDFWQCDNGGVYDNVGNKFRGHQYTDAQGKYTLTTIVPGLYPGRTRHIHVKVQAPGRGVLTTQLYFPNEPRNATDTIFDPVLLMNVTQVGNAKAATFDFLLNVTQTPPTTRPPTSNPPTTRPPTSNPPTTRPPTSAPPQGTWKAGTAYAAGAQVTYGGAGYRCLQGHTAMVGWEPPNVPALWARV
ncbi:dioxygenase family protein [Longispora urticae]